MAYIHYPWLKIHSADVILTSYDSYLYLQFFKRGYGPGFRGGNDIIDTRCKFDCLCVGVVPLLQEVAECSVKWLVPLHSESRLKGVANYGCCS